MANTHRIPFVLNLDDPVDTAIWEAIQPMLNRHRASQFIRGAVAHALGIGGLLPSVVSRGSPNGSSPVRALPAGEPRAKRPTRRATVEAEPISHSNGDEGALDEATGNFLNMFR
jgi:hypothetical protein